MSYHRVNDKSENYILVFRSEKLVIWNSLFDNTQNKKENNLSINESIIYKNIYNYTQKSSLFVYINYSNMSVNFLHFSW